MPDFVKQSESESHGLLQQYLACQSISPDLDPKQLLTQVSTAFAMLPYENLSKILRDHQTGIVEESRRLPSEVLHDHARWGTGGTCFSLTWTLLHLVRALGLQAEPILADRRYGPNTHCALVVWIDGVKHLLDPGYLLVNAIPFPKQEELIIPTSFQEVKLTPETSGSRVQLVTIHPDRSAHRLTYKTDPVDTGTFLRAWDESFDFDMMSYPVLSRVADGKQYYLQKQSLLIRSRESSERINLEPGKMVETIHTVFGIDPYLAEKSLQVLQ